MSAEKKKKKKKKKTTRPLAMHEWLEYVMY